MSPPRRYFVTYIDIDQPPGACGRKSAAWRERCPEPGDEVVRPESDGEIRLVFAVYWSAAAGGPEAPYAAFGLRRDALFTFDRLSAAG